MIVVMDPEAPERAVESVIAYLVTAGFDVHRSSGQSRTILGVVGEVTPNDVSVLREFEGVADVVRVSEPFRLASRRFRQQSTIVEGLWGSIGGDRPWIAIEPVGLAEPRRGDRGAVDDAQRPSELPYAIAAGRPFDAAITRGRRSPDGIGALACLSVHSQPAEARVPVIFVERNPSWGANSWIGAAERELERGESNVVLLEAGGEYPNGARTLEIAAIARAKIRTHLPIVVDVPTIAQRARYVVPVACAAIGAGADGVILRVWVGREDDVSRLPATLRWNDAVELADKLRSVGAIVRQ
jgi:3-deoxy-7-phosphoheptulonate synthase